MVRTESYFYTLLAFVTVVLAGLAAIVTHFGPTLAPSHFSSSVDAKPPLVLTQVAPEKAQEPGFLPNQSVKSSSGPNSAAGKTQSNGIVLDVQNPLLPQPRMLIKPGTQASTEPVETPREQTDDVVPLSPSEEKARETAKRKLAEKLARLRLATSLVAARAARRNAIQPNAEFATDPAETPLDPVTREDATVVVAALQDPTEIISDDRAELENLTDETPAAPLAGAITPEPEETLAVLHPVPGAKPEPTTRTSTSTAKRENERPQQPKPVLAYATPGTPEPDGEGAFSGIGKLFNGLKGGLPGRRTGIAVYDISAATVHMPDGSKLEAHSGIGHRKDNPKYAHVRNLGPTPPNIYDLRMRERRFHGVEAIRMLPRDHAAMKGRDGMLAHSPLLRRSNGSHGCVAFKDYNKFLKAFKAGKVKKIIVVPSMDELPKYMAALNRGAGA